MRSTHPGERPFRSRPGTAPRARTDDPESSHAAADTAEASGVIARELRAVTKAVELWPGCTARQLSERTGLSTHLLGRRLPELAPAVITWAIPEGSPSRKKRAELTPAGEKLAASIERSEIGAAVKATPREKAAIEALRKAHEELDAAQVSRVHAGERLPLYQRIALLAQRCQA